MKNCDNYDSPKTGYLYFHAKGFKICHIPGDGQFKQKQKYIQQMGIMVKITSRDEHVSERYIRMVKESVQATVNTLPFDKYPNRLIVATVYNASG